MNQQKQSVIVMENDPQILKGLVLLLEDMQFNVIPLHHYDELENIKTSLAGSPVLLILPFELANGEAGHERVMQLRTDFQQPIPAILRCYENGFSPDRFIHKDIVVLSDRVSAKDLRRTIATLLNHELVV